MGCEVRDLQRLAVPPRSAFCNMVVDMIGSDLTGPIRLLGISLAERLFPRHSNQAKKSHPTASP